MYRDCENSFELNLVVPLNPYPGQAFKHISVFLTKVTNFGTIYKYNSLNDEIPDSSFAYN